MRSLALLAASTMVQSCMSLPATKSQPVVTALPLQEVFERREALSGQRVTIQGVLFSDKDGAILGRSDESRTPAEGERNNCLRNSEADLFVIETSLMSGLHDVSGQDDTFLPEGRATREFRRANQHRVIVSGVLRTERTNVYPRVASRHLTFIIEHKGRLDDARLEHVYEDQCR